MKQWLGVATVVVAAAGLSGCGMTRFMDRTAVIAEPSPCTTRRFEVYFADSEARLTEPARQAIGMTAAGWPSPVFEVEAAGEAGAADAGGVREPMRRRTEVLIEAAPR